HMQGILTASLKIMARLNIAERRIPQDGRMQLEVALREVDILVSTLPTIFGEKIVMRFLDLSNALMQIEQLGFTKRNLAVFRELIQIPNGILLIAGPTGSGKSSTLYSVLNHLNQEGVNIITVEDPVEYQLEGINQVQVNTKIGMSFASALRSILRQDPDIIMVGEIRDTETAEIAIRAALTGHMVLSTIHTNDAVSSITRLIDMGIEPFLLASAVNGVVSQRLVRSICRDCKEEYQASEHEKEIFAQKGLKVETLWRGKGCANCNLTGYRGRIAVQEVFKIDEEIRQMILDVARKVIAEEGIAGLSIRKITSLIDYSPAIIYHYFKDKHEIVETIVNEGYGRILATISQVDTNEFEPELEIKQAFTAYIKAALSAPEEYKAVMLNDDPAIIKKTGVLEQGVTSDRATLQRLQHALQRGIDQGRFSPGDTELTAQVIWSSTYGLLIRLMIEKDIGPAQIDRLIDHHFTILFQGIMRAEFYQRIKQ
ncbi:MAG: Flp pilus assembly complex ATPase component TadA, partial [Gorillibacterium sp.]|nr:Flp pilus assembly complex ATPase component TadA [Gorillibacterium sp.]